MLIIKPSRGGLVREPKGFLTIPAHGGGSKLAPPLEGLNMNTKTFVNNINKFVV